MDDCGPSDGGLQRLSSTATIRRANPPPALYLLARASRASLVEDHLLSQRGHTVPKSAPLGKQQATQLSLQRPSTASSNLSISSQNNPFCLSHTNSYGSLSSRPDCGHDRSESTETVRGVPTSTEGTGTASNPLTPFPRYISGETYSSVDEPLITERSPFGSVRTLDFGTLNERSNPRIQPTLMLTSTSHKGMLSSVIHGVILGLQCTVMLAVFSSVVWVTVWKHTESSRDFWDWLWHFAVPSLGMAMLICFTTLIIHETQGLSTVSLLYLQTGILFLTTVTAMAIAMHCFEQESRAVKGVLMGCDVLMWGMAFLGFIRAAIIWKLECVVEHKGEMATATTTRQGGARYGTFVLWEEANAPCR